MALKLCWRDQVSLAHAAGADAANRRMRAEGRTVWNEEDYEECVRTIDRLWPGPMDCRPPPER